tara:strand:+ start:389 stop:586 length:198 start_codon:yes stop_codon:yes gene_type:complete
MAKTAESIKIKPKKKSKKTGDVASVKGAVKIIRSIQGPPGRREMVIKWVDKNGKVLQTSYGDLDV